MLFHFPSPVDTRLAASPTSNRTLRKQDGARPVSTLTRDRLQRRHRGQPLRRLLMAAADQLVKFLLQRARHGASLAIADSAKINLAQPNDLCRRAAYENFVGHIKLVAR